MANLPVYIMDGNLGVCSVTAEDLGLVTPFNFKDVLDTYDDLPDNPGIGDVYYITDEKCEYVWNGSEWKRIDLPSNASIKTKTSFEVYPTSFEVDSSLTAAELSEDLVQIIFGKKKSELTSDELQSNPVFYSIQSCNAQDLKVYSWFDQDEIDAYIDWGDGSSVYLSKVTPTIGSDGCYEYSVSHSYEETELRYRISIYGTRLHGLSCGSNNIICDFLNPIFCVGFNVLSVSGLCFGSDRIFRVDTKNVELPTYLDVSSLFQNCFNLKSARIQQYLFSTVRKLFKNDSELRTVDFSISPILIRKNGLEEVFSSCSNLEADINEILPDCGFGAETVSVDRLFYRCSKMYGIVPSGVLWRDLTVNWQNTSECFDGCSSDILSQVPIPWGGTSDEQIDKIATEKYVDEKIPVVPDFPVPQEGDYGKVITVNSDLEYVLANSLVNLQTVTAHSVTGELIRGSTVTDGRNVLGEYDPVTSFFVYANESAIPVGTNHPVLGLIQASPYNGGQSLPAQMTCKFALRTQTTDSESDVWIEWGDGNITKIATDELDWTQTDAGGGVVDVVAHTYSQEGKYEVKVHGLDYFGICHWLGVATQNQRYYNDSLNDNKECNLLCDLDGLKIASCLTNLSSFARCSQRLTKVKIDEASKFFGNVYNFSNMFLSCWNLSEFIGVGDKKTAIKACEGAFRDCRNLVQCDFQIPTCGNRVDYCVQCFYNCSKLQSSIDSLIPKVGFTAENIHFYGVFYNCSSLTGTVPSKLLWEREKPWGITENCFTGSIFESSAPASWGGRIAFEQENEDYRENIVLDMPLRGDCADYSGAGRTTVVTDASNPLKFIETGDSKCAFFNGNSGICIPAPNSGRFDFDGHDFSVCFWISKPSSNQWESVINKRANGGSADYYFGFNYDSLVFYNGVAQISNKALLKNLWHHIAMSIDSGTKVLTIYVDGEQIGTFQNASCETQSRQYLMIGSCCYVANPESSSVGNLVETLHGYLHDLRLYSSQLTNVQVKSIMDATEIGSRSEVEYVNGQTQVNLFLSANKLAYKFDISSGSATHILSCANTSGTEYIWNLDIVTNSSSSIQLDSMFDLESCDSLTENALNRCLVRWDGSKAILKVYDVSELN